MMDELWNDDQVLYIQSRLVGTGFGLRTDGIKGYAIQLGRLNVIQEVGGRLAHELGHAYSTMVDGVKPTWPQTNPSSKRRALEMDNMVRGIRGCSPRLVHDAMLSVPFCW